MYKPGDWNVICDRCGEKLKASEVRETWDGFKVHADRCWEPRHPQDFVHGVEDDQSVPFVRSDVIQSQGSTTLSASASKYAISIVVTSATGLSDGAAIGIILDNGSAHWTICNGAPSGTTVTLLTSLPYAASSGNTVLIPSLNNETWSSATTITATGL